MHRVKVTMMFVLLSGAALVRAEGELATLSLTGIEQVNEDGFGTDANKYAFSMAEFKDALYVGTLNLKNMPAMFNFFTGARAAWWSGGAEVWRWDKEGNWTRVVEGGLGNPRNLGVRKLMVINDCLYGVTANHDDGMEVWRTCDGTTWEKCAERGFGDPRNTSGRGLGFLNGMIYVGTENRERGAQLWRSADGKRWEKAAEAGISDPKNIWLSDFVVFKDRMYMGTLNLSGFQLYRTREGRHFERLIKDGLAKKTNWGAAKLFVFQDKLFLGTMDFLDGFDLYLSRDGENFKRVITSGFRDKHYAYLWQMEEFHGRLYAGLYYHRGLQLPIGSFALLSSPDGENWEVENDDGFGNPWYYGIRTLAVFNDRLIIGTASAKFGCKVFAASARPSAEAEEPPG